MCLLTVTRKKLLLATSIVGIGVLGWWQLMSGVIALSQTEKPTMKLPAPIRDGRISIEQTLSKRRSVREFDGRAISLAQLGQLLWAAQGQTGEAGYRTAPSAGALYPLETYAVVGNVDGLEPGIYRYEPASHELIKIAGGDKRRELAVASLEQMWMADAPTMIVLSAVYERTTNKYGRRGVRYVDMEIGHVGQNIALQAVALGLGTTTVGAFEDKSIKAIMNMKGQETPLYILPVGR